MNELKNRDIHCPYCGEKINVFLDCSIAHQQYIEDCQVCCRPIIFDVSVVIDGKVLVTVSSEND